MGIHMIVQEVFSGTSTSSVFARLQISGSLVLVSVGLGLMYRGNSQKSHANLTDEKEGKGSRT